MNKANVAQTISEVAHNMAKYMDNPLHSRLKRAAYEIDKYPPDEVPDYILKDAKELIQKCLEKDLKVK